MSRKIRILVPVYASGSLRVRRGGCWNYVPAIARVAYRDGNTPGIRRGDLGFRLLMTEIPCPER